MPANPVIITSLAPTGLGILTLTGASTAGVAGNVRYAGLILGAPAWSSDGSQTAGAANVIVEYTGTAWKVSLGAAYLATKTSGAADPTGLTAWTVTTGTGSPVVAAGVLSPPPIITA